LNHILQYFGFISTSGVLESDYPEDDDEITTNASKFFQVVNDSVDSVCGTETGISRRCVNLVSSVDRPSTTVEIVRSFGMHFESFLLGDLFLVLLSDC